jgi:hypothetical protein
MIGFLIAKSDDERRPTIAKPNKLRWLTWARHFYRCQLEQFRENHTKSAGELEGLIRMPEVIWEQRNWISMRTDPAIATVVDWRFTSV